MPPRLLQLLPAPLCGAVGASGACDRCGDCGDPADVATIVTTAQGGDMCTSGSNVGTADCRIAGMPAPLTAQCAACVDAQYYKMRQGDAVLQLPGIDTIAEKCTAGGRTEGSRLLPAPVGTCSASDVDLQMAGDACGTESCRRAARGSMWASMSDACYLCQLATQRRGIVGRCRPAWEGGLMQLDCPNTTFAHKFWTACVTGLRCADGDRAAQQRLAECVRHGGGACFEPAVRELSAACRGCLFGSDRPQIEDDCFEACSGNGVGYDHDCDAAAECRVTQFMCRCGGGPCDDGGGSGPAATAGVACGAAACVCCAAAAVWLLIRRRRAAFAAGGPSPPDRTPVDGRLQHCLGAAAPTLARDSQMGVQYHGAQYKEYGPAGRAGAVRKGAYRAPAMMVDTTGDGRNDHMLVDTTGDGRMDTAIPL